MTQQMLLDSLAAIGALTCLYAVVRVLAAVFRWAQTPVPEKGAAVAASAPAAAACVPAQGADDIAADDIAVIAAAVAVMWEKHRIVHIENADNGLTWSAEGRWLHQTSHRTH